jgi:hypothetical protein
MAPEKSARARRRLVPPMSTAATQVGVDRDMGPLVN